MKIVEKPKGAKEAKKTKEKKKEKPQKEAGAEAQPPDSKEE
jgi:hypothetical protein